MNVTQISNWVIGKTVRVLKKCELSVKTIDVNHVTTCIVAL